MKLETKLLAATEADFDVDEKTGAIAGYGSIFGNVDQGGDIVVKGAFGKSLMERPNVKMLWGHDAFSPPIGVWEDVSEDNTGLKMSGRLFMETERGREAHTALKAGAIDGLSIGYQTVSAKDTKAGRELRELKLFEVSVVNFPMNEAAAVETVKSFANPAEQKRILEATLRDAGFSKSEAKHGASLLVSEVLGRDDASTAAAMASDLKQFMRDLRD